MDSPLQLRQVTVPEGAGGMRLDRFLALWFRDWSRTTLAKAARNGEITDASGKKLLPSHVVRAGEVLQLAVKGIAPDGPPPPFPPILYEDDRLVIIDKPAGLLAHPTGSAFAWSAVGLAKLRWPAEKLDLAHRLDRDTSGILVLTKDLEANRAIKQSLVHGEAQKTYFAVTRGIIREDRLRITDPLGPADGPIRIQRAVRPDGQSAATEVTVLARQTDDKPPMTQVACRIETGRTHQIRVHLATVSGGLVGDRLYGVPTDVFLDAWEHGVSARTIAAAGAPRHALHAWKLGIPHPGGHLLEVEAPWPDDILRWWADPSVLPFDGRDESEFSGEAEAG